MRNFSLLINGNVILSLDLYYNTQQYTKARLFHNTLNNIKLIQSKEMTIGEIKQPKFATTFE